jgi:predicted Zn finger-like uncharacterized protein
MTDPAPKKCPVCQRRLSIPSIGSPDVLAVLTCDACEEKFIVVRSMIRMYQRLRCPKCREGWGYFNKDLPSPSPSL